MYGQRAEDDRADHRKRAVECGQKHGVLHPSRQRMHAKVQSYFRRALAHGRSQMSHTQDEVTLAAPFKTAPEIVIRTLSPSLAVAKNSPPRIAARIFFDRFHPDWNRFSSASVYVELEPALLLEIGDEADGLVRGAGSKLRDDIDQRPLDILCHALGIAANIHVRAFGEPCPQLAPDLAHAVLNIEFLGSVT